MPSLAFYFKARDADYVNYMLRRADQLLVCMCVCVCMQAVANVREDGIQLNICCCYYAHAVIQSHNIPWNIWQTIYLAIETLCVTMFQKSLLLFLLFVCDIGMKFDVNAEKV